MDKLYIKSLMQNILDKTFSEINKRIIVSYENRYNFCCPVCGDSTKSASKKRGNIFFDRLLFVCFRCNYKCSITKFCKEFEIQMDPSKKMEMIEYLSSTIKHSDYQSDMSEVNFEDLINLTDLEETLSTNKHTLTDFRPVAKDGVVYNYLLDRGIDSKFHKNIYQAKSWQNAERYEPVMVILNRKDNKILGIQTRNLKSGKFRSFKIYNFETLYRWVNNIDADIEEIDDVDINQLFIYNKLSNFFNILNIDFDNTITIFEGYLDSMFYPNSIGVVGVNTNMNLLESNNLDIQYFFDNDDAGFTKSEEKIKAGFKIFLWKKLFQDIVERKNSPDPYSLMYRISSVKDLNKLAQLISDPYKSLKLGNFFSNDIFDIKWIPKKVYKKFNKY